MKKILIILASLLSLAHIAAAGDYRYISADELKGLLDVEKPVLLVDIQEAGEFAAHHIRGSLETNGYPVKSEEERQRLQPALQESQTKEYEAIVVVCPRGKGGAKRAYDFLLENGVPEAELFILTGGMADWPHAEWVAKK